MIDLVVDNLYTLFGRNEVVLAWVVGLALVRWLLRSLVRLFRSS